MGKQILSVVIIIILTFVELLMLKSKAMVYQEPLNFEDLNSLFGEDGCMEGSLSMMETGGPTLNPISFVTSEHISVKEDQNNDIDYFEKSPMSLIHELAAHNKINIQYILTDEKGPSHKKQFVVSLKLGEETYFGEGNSIKKAQHEAARSAMNSTIYDYPQNTRKMSKPSKHKRKPVEHLDSWARKHNNALIHYSFIEQSVSHNNYYHKDMYSSAQNIHKVTVTVGNQVYHGEGESREVAQNNAANDALKNLQNSEGFCMLLNDNEKSLFSKILSFDSNNESPVSLVFEFGSVSNMKVSFDLHSEVGPPHMKKFVYKCNIDGQFETLGEGPSKKEAKKEAAVNMIKKLKIHASLNNFNCLETPKKSRPKKKKPKNLIKNVKSYAESEESVVEYLPPENLDPISKLFQIQQGKHENLPVFTSLGERNNKFLCEVKINDLTFVGSGPNKKIAKKNAARGILEQMGYSSSSEINSSSQHKKNEFIEHKDTSVEKKLTPSIRINSHEIPQKYKNNRFSNNDGSKYIKTSSSSDYQEKNENNHKPNKKTDPRPKVELENLAQQLNFKFQFSDFPRANNSEFVSLISLTTDPPRVCYGIGNTVDISQDNAALSALSMLYKCKINHISELLREETSSMPIKKEIVTVEKEEVILSPLTKTTE